MHYSIAFRLLLHYRKKSLFAQGSTWPPTEFTRRSCARFTMDELMARIIYAADSSGDIDVLDIASQFLSEMEFMLDVRDTSFVMITIRDTIEDIVLFLKKEEENVDIYSGEYIGDYFLDSWIPGFY